MRVFSSGVAPVIPNTGHRVCDKAGAHPGRVRRAHAGKAKSVPRGWVSWLWLLLVLLLVLLLPGPAARASAGAAAAAAAAARDDADDNGAVGDVRGGGEAAAAAAVTSEVVTLRRFEVRSPDKG